MFAAAKSVAAYVSGSEIRQKYTLDTSHSASGGYRYLYKIFNGTHKKTGMPVSIFIMDKNDPRISAMERSSKEALFESVRRDIHVLKAFALSKPSPNPYVLHLYEALEETKKEFSFSTERVKFSLGNRFRDFTNLPPQSITEVSEM